MTKAQFNLAFTKKGEALYTSLYELADMALREFTQVDKEDLKQQVVVDVYNILDSITAEDPFNYIFTVMRNRAVQLIRKDRHWREYGELTGEEESETIFDTLAELPESLVIRIRTFLLTGKDNELRRFPYEA